MPLLQQLSIGGSFTIAQHTTCTHLASTVQLAQAASLAVSSIFHRFFILFIPQETRS